MIDPKKQYRTRDGREVRIYATDGCNGHRIHGAIYDGLEHGWQHRAWFHGGRMHCEPSGADLIEVKPRIKRKAWVNVYSDGLGTTNETRERADRQAGGAARIACVEIDIDVEEGHGL